MLYACVQRFDVTKNVKKFANFFGKLNWTPRTPSCERGERGSTVRTSHRPMSSQKCEHKCRQVDSAGLSFGMEMRER